MEQNHLSENPNATRVDLENGHAMVTTDGHQFSVFARNQHGATSGCPTQLMIGALGACIMLTLNAVAQHKGIDLQQPQVFLDRIQQKNGGSRFQVALKLDDHLTDRERRILFQSARICEVGKILKGDVQIDYCLEDGNAAAASESCSRSTGSQPAEGPVDQMTP